MGMTLPTRLIRVDWWCGFGWPECIRQERTFRTFNDPARAARMVRVIQSLPSHHALIGVWESDTNWKSVDLDRLLTEEPDDRNRDDDTTD